MAKQCLGVIREDSNMLCQQDMFDEMERLGKQLGDYAEQAKKDIENQKEMSKYINYEEMQAGVQLDNSDDKKEPSQKVSSEKKLDIADIMVELKQKDITIQL